MAPFPAIQPPIPTPAGDDPSFNSADLPNSVSRRPSSACVECKIRPNAFCDSSKLPLSFWCAISCSRSSCFSCECSCFSCASSASFAWTARRLFATSSAEASCALRRVSSLFCKEGSKGETSGMAEHTRDQARAKRRLNIRIRRELSSHPTRTRLLMHHQMRKRQDLVEP